jgi:hypothetical protein
LEVGLRIICPGWPQTTILPVSAYQVARITGMSHWCLAGVDYSLVYCLSWFAKVLCVYVYGWDWPEVLFSFRDLSKSSLTHQMSWKVISPSHSLQEFLKFKEKNFLSAWWLMPAISTTWEMKIGKDCGTRRNGQKC